MAHEDNVGMLLDYLDFDLSEDGHGNASWDAMACVLPARLGAALRDAETVLAWAHNAFGAPGDWGEWDFDIQCQQDGASPLALAFDTETGSLNATAPAMAAGRATLTLTLSGTQSFGEALRERFSIP